MDNEIYDCISILYAGIYWENWDWYITSWNAPHCEWSSWAGFADGPRWLRFLLILSEVIAYTCRHVCMVFGVKPFNFLNQYFILFFIPSMDL